MTIEESNVLIADFMQVEKHICSTPDCYEYGSRVFYTPEKMKYDSDWNWIMPVWKKTSTEIGLFMSIHKIEHYGKLWNEKGDEIRNAILTVNIKIAHIRIAELIKWHKSEIEKL